MKSQHKMRLNDELMHICKLFYSSNVYSYLDWIIASSEWEPSFESDLNSFSFLDKQNGCIGSRDRRESDWKINLNSVRLTFSEYFNLVNVTHSNDMIERWKKEFPLLRHFQLSNAFPYVGGEIKFFWKKFPFIFLETTTIFEIFNYFIRFRVLTQKT